MQQPVRIPDVGAQDPERRNSPVAEELDYEAQDLRQELVGEPCCYFNDQAFANGARVRSGSALLRCDYGIWVNEGPADALNP